MTISHVISNSFGLPKFNALVRYRDESQRDYDADRQGAFSYVAKFTLIEAGFLTLGALCVAGSIVRLVISLGLYAYDKITGTSGDLTERSFEMAIQSGVIGVFSLYSTIAHLFAGSLRLNLISIRDAIVS